MTLWEIDVYPAAGEPDILGRDTIHQAADLGLGQVSLSAARGFLVQGDISAEQIQTLAHRLLADVVVERVVVGKVGDPVFQTAPEFVKQQAGQLVHVLPRPGVTDQVADSAKNAMADFGIQPEAVCTLRKYWVEELPIDRLKLLTTKLLANDSIERVVNGPLTFDYIQLGSPYQFNLEIVPIRELSDEALVKLSKARTLSLTLVEMHTVAQHFRDLQRDPTDAELESVAQTWSEHCSHKTLAGQIRYVDEKGERQFKNMLKETIFAATQTIRKSLGENDWCVSVFRDNAGIVKFDDKFHVAFKVETHNRPSAIEPYGGANTGVGGVIRDTLGTGMGAKPICNTDVFCFAPPDMPIEDLPPGVLHPRRIMRGVVAGVRDYGNRMGIPTVNGAIYFDPRYVGNPMVYCGNVGLIPHDKAFKEVQPGDLIVAMGGRTGRDGIHGATFSSVELTSKSEKESGGAVQIGNAITEKMVLDVLLAARDAELFTAVTDCGAGGFSSAVGEMGGEIGAEVWLDKCPLKYEGLSYSEIWISEAQERMVMSVPEDKWPALQKLAAGESVEATVIGKFVPTKRLVLKYHDQVVADISMDFLHEGRPRITREATYTPQEVKSLSPDPNKKKTTPSSPSKALKKLLGCLNIASKEWVIRQYDHEVQAGSVIKPLVGVANDGPSDAAVIRPVLDSRRGVVVGCGMNPRLGDFDPYQMALASIDEAMRNCVAVGADPSQIAILDNFCWGYTDRPETLGSLVRAALGCQDAAVALGTPFISGKDSLNNEYSYDLHGERKTIQIPPSLLISALGQVDDVRKCVTMDLKEAGNYLYVVGQTASELGGSHLALVEGLVNGRSPSVDLPKAKQTFHAMHQAISNGLVRACHDVSEGGLAVALAEMAFAGGLGAKVTLASVPHCLTPQQVKEDGIPGGVDGAILFSESATRFVVEVPADKAKRFETLLVGIPCAKVGEVTTEEKLQVQSATGSTTIIDESLQTLKECWQAPLRW